MANHLHQRMTIRSSGRGGYDLSEVNSIAIIVPVPNASSVLTARIDWQLRFKFPPARRGAQRRQTSCEPTRGQVAQVVERSPEKAGVGGSTPSLATTIINRLADQPEISHL
jgi:hypothetical protein